jgi:hypothetical protein
MHLFLNFYYENLIETSCRGYISTVPERRRPQMSRGVKKAVISERPVRCNQKWEKVLNVFEIRYS